MILVFLFLNCVFLYFFIVLATRVTYYYYIFFNNNINKLFVNCVCLFCFVRGVHVCRSQFHFNTGSTLGIYALKKAHHFNNNYLDLFNWIF